MFIWVFQWGLRHIFFFWWFYNVKFKKLNLQGGSGTLWFSRSSAIKICFPLSFIAFIFHESEFAFPWINKASHQNKNKFFYWLNSDHFTEFFQSYFQCLYVSISSFGYDLNWLLLQIKVWYIFVMGHIQFTLHDPTSILWHCRRQQAWCFRLVWMKSAVSECNILDGLK